MSKWFAVKGIGCSQDFVKQLKIEKTGAFRRFISSEFRQNKLRESRRLCKQKTGNGVTVESIPPFPRHSRQRRTAFLSYHIRTSLSSGCEKTTLERTVLL